MAQAFGGGCYVAALRIQVTFVKVKVFGFFQGVFRDFGEKPGPRAIRLKREFYVWNLYNVKSIYVYIY